MRWRIAIALGYPHPDYLLRQLSSAQLTELECFWDIDGGFGDHKDEYRFAQLCAIQAEINRDKKKRPQPFSIKDFLLIPQDPDKLQEKKNNRVANYFKFLSQRPKKQKGKK